MVGGDVLRFKIPEVDGKEDEEILFYFDKEVGAFRARLPSGKNPLIQPVNPRVMHRMVRHFRSIEPAVPKTSVRVPGKSIAQEFEEKQDPEYLEAHATWTEEFMDALLLRSLWDGLIIPENDEWAVRLTRSGMPVPQEGPDRSEAYAEEVYPTLLGLASPADQGAFVEAVRQLSVPTDEVVEAVRRKFRNALARDTPDGAEVPGGGVHLESGDGGASSASAISDTGDAAVGDNVG